MAVVRLLKLNKPKSHILAVMPSHCHSYYSCAWSSCYSRLIPFCDLHLRSPLSLAYRLCRIQPRPFWLLLVTCRQQATHDGAGGCFFFLFSSFSVSPLSLLALFAYLLFSGSAFLASFSFFACFSLSPPCFFLFVFSVSFFLLSLSFLRFSLLSLFSSLLFSSNRLLSQQQRKVNKGRKPNRKNNKWFRFGLAN